MHDFIAHIINHLAELDRIPVAVIALLLTGIIGFLTGPLGSNTNPLMWNIWHALFSPLGKRLNRSGRRQAALFARGLFVTLFALLISALTGRILIGFTLAVPQYSAVETLILCCFLSTGAVWKDSLKPQTSSKEDQHTIARITINRLIYALDKMLVAPIVLYFIAGLPMACVYSAISFLVWRFGREAPEKAFSFSGSFIALEKIFGIIPHIISSLCLTCASVISPGANPVRALKAWFGLKDRSPYTQGGLALSIAAWALNASLGGPYTDVDGKKYKHIWTGPEGSSAKIKTPAIHRALFLTIVAFIFFTTCILGVYIAFYF